MCFRLFGFVILVAFVLLEMLVVEFNPVQHILSRTEGVVADVAVTFDTDIAVLKMTATRVI